MQAGVSAWSRSSFSLLAKLLWVAQSWLTTTARHHRGCLMGVFLTRARPKLLPRVGYARTARCSPTEPEGFPSPALFMSNLTHNCCFTESRTVPPNISLVTGSASSRVALSWEPLNPGEFEIYKEGQGVFPPCWAGQCCASLCQMLWVGTGLQQAQ